MLNSLKIHTFFYRLKKRFKKWRNRLKQIKIKNAMLEERQNEIQEEQINSAPFPDCINAPTSDLMGPGGYRTNKKRELGVE